MRLARWLAAPAAVLSLGLLTACGGGGALGPATPTGASATSVVAGTVTYHTAHPLPPGARIEVSLQDVSGPDVGPVDAMSMLAMGRRPPLPWTIAYDPASLDREGTYVVTARVFVRGKVVLRTTTPQAVITNGTTTGLRLVVDSPRPTG